MYAVNKILTTVRQLSQRSEDTKGVALWTLSKECQELAGRCDCGSLSYLFILPECYIQAREALVILHQWLDEDMKYNEFIET